MESSFTSVTLLRVYTDTPRKNVAASSEYSWFTSSSRKVKYKIAVNTAAVNTELMVIIEEMDSSRECGCGKRKREAKSFSAALFILLSPSCCVHQLLNHIQDASSYQRCNRI